MKTHHQAGQASSTGFVIPDPDVSTFERIVQVELTRVRKAAAANPNNADAVGLIGMYFHAYNMLSAADPCYQRAIELAPQNFQWRYYLGRAQMAAGDAESAIATFEAARQIDSHYIPLMVNLGVLYTRQGRYDEAVTILRSALEHDPQSYQAHAELGITLSQQGKTDEAVEHFIKSVQTAPYAPAHFALANIYRSRGQLEKARQHFELWKRSPEVFLQDPLMTQVDALNYSSKVRMRLARQLFQLGRRGEAINVLKDLLKHYPDRPDIHERLAQMLEAMGMHDEAVHHIQERDRLLN